MSDPFSDLGSSDPEPNINVTDPDPRIRIFFFGKGRISDHRRILWSDDFVRILDPINFKIRRFSASVITSKEVVCFCQKKQLQPNPLNKDPYWKKRPCPKFSRATWDPKRESQCPFKMDRPKNLILIRAFGVCRRLGPAYFLGKNFDFRTHVSTSGAKNMPKIVPFNF